MASMVANTALTTDAHPLTPQAQGIMLGAISPNFASASGNGIPMKKAKGAIIINVKGIFAAIDND